MDSSRKGERPPPPSVLKVCKESFKTRKPPPPPSSSSSVSGYLSPVIVHMRAPRVVHARPQDFMRVVQLLTGKPSPPTPTPTTEPFFPPARYGYAGGLGGSDYFASDVNYAPDVNEAYQYQYSGDPPRSSANGLAREFRFR